MLVEPDAGKSLQDDLVLFCREALYLQTPLQVVLNSSELANHVCTMPHSDKVKHQQFTLDIEANKNN